MSDALQEFLSEWREPERKALRAGLEVLARAFKLGRNLGGDSWQCAVELVLLSHAGLDGPALHWLIRKGFARHAYETTESGDATRSFRSAGHGPVTARSVFQATEIGAGLFARWNDLRSEEAAESRRRDATGEGAAEPTLEIPCPHWDEGRSRLYVGDVVVKWFRRPAANQTRILAVLEELGWPVRIDDPLPPEPEMVASVRLARTVTKLNDHQSTEALRFHTSGAGTEVYWEILPKPWKTRPDSPSEGGERS